MKKSVLGVAIVVAAFAASVASAVQVYDKDGSTLAVGDKVEFVAESSNTNYFTNFGKDASAHDPAALDMAFNPVVLIPYLPYFNQYFNQDDDSLAIYIPLPPVFRSGWFTQDDDTYAWARRTHPTGGWEWFNTFFTQDDDTYALVRK